MHSNEFAENQGKHQSFDPFVLPYKFGLIFMGMKQKKIFYRKNLFLLHPHENQSKFLGQQGWIEILMITLVSRKFLATCVIQCT